MANRRLISIRTKYGSHIGVFETDPDKGGFVVTGKELPGVVTWGRNLAHAKKMAKEAMELCIECLVEEQLRAGFSRRKTVSVR